MSEPQAGACRISAITQPPWRGSTPVRGSIAFAMRIIAIILVCGTLVSGHEFARDTAFIAAMCLFTIGAAVARLRGPWRATDMVFVGLGILSTVRHLLR